MFIAVWVTYYEKVGGLNYVGVLTCVLVGSYFLHCIYSRFLGLVSMESLLVTCNDSIEMPWFQIWTLLLIIWLNSLIIWFNSGFLVPFLLAEDPFVAYCRFNPFYFRELT
jgi:hypothetical protein